MNSLPVWARMILFAGSVSPIVILQGLLELLNGGPLPWVLLTVGAALFFYPLALFGLAHHFPLRSHSLVETRYSTPNVAAFLLAYLLPVAGLSVRRLDEAFVFAFLIVLIGVLYTRGGLLYVQPVFVLAGREVYECLTKEGEWCWYLTKRPVGTGTHQFRDLGSHTCVDYVEAAQPEPASEPAAAPAVNVSAATPVPPAASAASAPP